jgi:hypothetical protein
VSWTLPPRLVTVLAVGLASACSSAGTPPPADGASSPEADGGAGDRSSEAHVSTDGSTADLPASVVPSGRGRIATGNSFACVIDTSHKVQCWGGSQLNKPPAGDVSFLAAGVASACAVQMSGELVCWSPNTLTDDVATGIPMGRFDAVAIGGDDVSEFACAHKQTGEVRCWQSGRGSDPARVALPTTRFTTVALGARHGCGLASDGSIQCWGAPSDAVQKVPAGMFVGIGAGADLSCARRAAGGATCWGGTSNLDAEFPTVTRISDLALYPAEDTVCLLVEDGRVACWGTGAFLTQSASAHRFQEIAVGRSHLCGIHADQTIACITGSPTGGDLAPPAGVHAVGP